VSAKVATKWQHFLEATMSVTVGKYHLFKRSRKRGDFFYYWFEEGNKRIIKTCGRACTDKKEAVAYLEGLLKQELVGIKLEISIEGSTLVFCKIQLTK
jgi:hypothetical protein